MNTNGLKKFAQEARRKLLEQVSSRLEYVLNTDTPELREKRVQVEKLREEIRLSSREQVIDKVSYTWFNRFMALRFMDANDYQPIGVRVLTPRDGYIIPELLDDAKQGNIPEALSQQSKRIFDLLDGKLPSANGQNEAYKELLIGACNHLNKLFPFLFERISDYTELLLPDDLISELSIIKDVIEGMSIDDCKDVEIVGWLYQFYISEKKDEVFAKKSAVKKEDIPAATQLFTPRWIVEYLVQNTVGKMWLQNHPNSKLQEQMPYFINSQSHFQEDFIKINSVEELTLLDQACGSGHILVYGFELFSKIYEEEGYEPSEIPLLIIKNNLFGFEIDERAAQLANFALMMKARSYDRKFFKNEIKPNILCYSDLNLNVYNVDGFNEVFLVKKDSPELESLLQYQYNIAENIEELVEEDFKDEDTGEVVTIKRTKKYIRKGEITSPKDLLNINLFGGKEISFHSDEIKESFMLTSIPLSQWMYEDISVLKQSTNYGSLISPKSTHDDIASTLILLNERIKYISDAFLKHKLEQIKTALEQLFQLSRKFHCIADNPPYMGGNMNPMLANFVKINYPDSKSDLMTCFMESGWNMLYPNGILGMINLPSWLFLSSFEKLRRKLINEKHIASLLHMGRGIFGVDWGSTAFIVHNKSENSNGRYFKLHKRNFQHLYPEDIKQIFLRAKNDEDTKINFDKYREGQGISTLDELIDESGLKISYFANQKDFEKIPGSPIGYWLTEKLIHSFSNELMGKRTTLFQGIITGNNEIVLRTWNEVEYSKFDNKLKSIDDFDLERYWVPYNKGGQALKWYGNLDLVVNFKKKGKNFTRGKHNFYSYFFNECFSWNYIGSNKSMGRYYPPGVIWDVAGSSGFMNSKSELLYRVALITSTVGNYILSVLNPTINLQVENIAAVPVIESEIVQLNLVETNIEIAKLYWDSKETSWDFTYNELLKKKGQDIEESFELFKQYWINKFHQLHRNEEALNKQFLEVYDLKDELIPDVLLEEITILKDESFVENGKLVFKQAEVFAQFISYAVGCMFGRYSLDREGLILANQGETVENYLQKVALSKENLCFLPDNDNIIPILDEEWFEDDISERFYAFLKACFGNPNFEKNLAFVEECLGKDIRKYFIKDFYADHVQRYKKRPIYWMFSSPKGTFNALIYMHRYTPDTLHKILNSYLIEYREKLKTHVEHLDHVIVSGTSTEQTKASKEKDKLKLVLLELQEYERDILYPIATERININLDDGVLVNYNKFGKAIKEVTGLNDKATKKKVKEFDWINFDEIR